MLGKVFGKLGIKPITDLVTSENGLVSLLKEGNDPKAKISSRRSAASALVFTGITLSMGELSKERLILIGVFVLCGTGLLAVTALGKK